MRRVIFQRCRHFCESYRAFWKGGCVRRKAQVIKESRRSGDAQADAEEETMHERRYKVTISESSVDVEETLCTLGL